MKKRFGNLFHSIAFVLLVFAGVALLSTSTMAAERQASAQEATVSIAGDLKVGHPVKAIYDLKGYAIPNGSYASINVRFDQKPDGANPLVKAGYPETILTFHTPGNYRITFILNEVSKPSCGGVNAIALLEETVDLFISE